MDVESNCHHCFKPSKYFCSRTNASMCLTLASLFGLLLCNICTCSIYLFAQHVSFLFLFFCFFPLSILFPLCVSEKIHWKLTVGAMLMSLTIVWVRKTYCLKMCMHTQHHAYICVGIHMLECVALLSCLSVNVFCMLRWDQLVWGLLWLIWCSITRRPYCLRCQTWCSEWPFWE